MAGKSNKEEANNANKIQAFCVGNSLVLIRNEKVIPIKIADKFIIEAIDELIESGQVCGKDPVVFFGIAVKNTIGVILILFTKVNIIENFLNISRIKCVLKKKEKL